jgi:hypothetical protein
MYFLCAQKAQTYMTGVQKQVIKYPKSAFSKDPKATLLTQRNNVDMKEFFTNLHSQANQANVQHGAQAVGNAFRFEQAIAFGTKPCFIVRRRVHIHDPDSDYDDTVCLVVGETDSDGFIVVQLPEGSNWVGFYCTHPKTTANLLQPIINCKHMPLMFCVAEIARGQR